MSRILEMIRRLETPVQAPSFWRVIYDYESPDWGYKSRTWTVQRADGSYFSQLPAVYGYSPEPADKPNDYHVDESGWQDDYYELNDFNVDGIRDGEGVNRCESFLFKGSVALYNIQNQERGFPRRELLTMSGNKLQEIAWGVDAKGRRYLKFKTLRPGSLVAGMTFDTHPDLVHRFMVVGVKNDITTTTPKISRNGYLHYYLVSREGYGYMPERYVKRL